MKDEKSLAQKLEAVGRKIEEFEKNPESFSQEYADLLEVERIGLLSRYYRRYYQKKVVHIDAKRFKTGKL